MHRITWISNITGKATTRKFATEAKARNEWGGIINSRFMRYAIWAEMAGETIKIIHAEAHSAFYLRDRR